MMEGGEKPMKQTKVDVKSKGKVLGTVNVTVYETLEEAIKASSKEAVLAAYNKKISDGITNTFRSEQVRDLSPIAKLTKAAKSDPKVAAQIEAILAKLS